ncbi:MAG: hypothetical protein MI923_09090 [Phycisphaerales bacterium]|nr:hypothetical protein [Phycisphaerales bacterium]
MTIKTKSLINGKRRKQPRLRAFTLVEAILSSMVVGLMLVGALEAVRTVHTIRDATLNHAKGQLLAEDLLAEIVKHDYADGDGSSGMGQDSGEAGTDRREFDDVDDYHNWSPSAPLNVDGTQMDGMDGWTRGVVVEYVNPNDLAQVSANNTGIKRITVTVRYLGEVITVLQTVRTSAVASVHQYEMAQGIDNPNDTVTETSEDEYELHEGGVVTAEIGN